MIASSSPRAQHFPGVARRSRLGALPTPQCLALAGARSHCQPVTVKEVEAAWPTRVTAWLSVALISITT
eukprot:g40304.t1